MKVSGYVVSRPFEKREFSTLGMAYWVGTRVGLEPKGKGKTLMSLPRIEPRVSGTLGRHYID